MGKLDTVTKEYMSKPQYFADAFNSCVFSGMQIVKPDSLMLQEIDPTELGIVISNDAEDIVQKIRDVLKKSTVMSDGRMTYLLLGVENQSEIHYAMPVKNLIYDALNYGKQVEKIASQHRKDKNIKGAEFLSGFSKTDFGKAMKYIAASEEPKKIKELSKDVSFEKVSADTVYLINKCTNSNIEIPKGEEVVNMCKGLEGYGAEKHAEGVIDTLVSLVQKGLLAVKDAAAQAGMSVEEFQKNMNAR